MIGARRGLAMLQRGPSYAAVSSTFQWAIPQTYNIGYEITDKHATTAPDAVALTYQRSSCTNDTEDFTFGMLRQLSNRLANLLLYKGVRRGDRVGVLLPQCPETVLAHAAVFKIGGIAVPLFTLFGPEALAFRLGNAGVTTLITDTSMMERIVSIGDRIPALKTVLVTDSESNGERTGMDERVTMSVCEHYPGFLPSVASLWKEMDAASDQLTHVSTSPTDPALIIFTSGTTGQPKGCLHGHQVLLGHLPGVEFPHNFFPQSGDRFWTPADWAWIGGLIDVLLPSLASGIPVIAFRAPKFDPEYTFHFLAQHRVRNAFLPPTALKMMRSVASPATTSLRSIGSGGESMGESILEWGKSTFGVTINEFYGQTEANLIVANCHECMPVKPGSMGRPVPGHHVSIVDPDGNELPRGSTGDIALHRPDPTIFLRYWNNEAATAAKFRGQWLVTGDQGYMDDDGYLWYVGRDDDVITSSGYRIGPGEIENVINQHPAVTMSAVVGKSDSVRTQIVKAFIVVRGGHQASPKLAEEIQRHVKSRLAAYEYPREIEFVDALPMTITGKIQRRKLRS